MPVEQMDCDSDSVRAASAVDVLAPIALQAHLALKPLEFGVALPSLASLVSLPAISKDAGPGDSAALPYHTNQDLMAELVVELGRQHGVGDNS